MIQVIRASERHFTDYNWLQTYWLFSFADYYDPDNIQFGALRVVNDDVVQPHKGFGTHPHEEMEIITIVLEGEVTHADSLGTKAVIRAGDVQRMSAGTGIRHSEFNLGDVPAHFYQIWLYPDTRGVEPGYGQQSFAAADRTNRLLPVAS
jgi:redox-sensitive bicupin YhaK (pirin superfamily)